MAAPTLQASGTIANVTSGNLTVTLPTHQANDILIVVVSGWVPNTTTGTNVMAAPAGGWVKLLSDSLINTTIDGEWAIFWLRASAAGTTNPVFTRPTSWDTGTDTAWGGRAYVIRGCETVGNPWDAAVKSALHSTANQALPAVTVSGSERTVIHFLAKADDNGAVTAATGWTLDTAVTSTTGTDCSFQTIRKNNVSASTTADTATITAPVTGLRYQFYGISFKPGTPVTINPVESVSAAVSDVAQLSVHSAPTTITPVESVSATVSDTAQLTVTTLQTTVTPVESVSATVSDTAQLTATTLSGPLLVTDDFNRADNTSLGSNWTETGNVTASLSISGNSIVHNNSGTHSCEGHWTAATFNANHWSEADCTATGTAREVWVAVRQTGRSYYAGVWDTNGDYRIYYSNAGAWTSLALNAGVAGTTGTKTLRMEAVGTKLTLYANGVEVLTTTHATLTSGSPGIGIWGGSGPSIDNFRAGDVDPIITRYSTNGNGETYHRLTIPPGVAAGDFALVFRMGGNYVDTNPTGWTVHVGVATNFGDCVVSKTVSSTDITNGYVELNGTTIWAGYDITAWWFPPGTTVGAAATPYRQFAQARPYAWTHPSVTSTADNAYNIVMIGGQNGFSDITGEETYWINDFDRWNPTGMAVHLYHYTKATAGASGTTAISATADTDWNNICSHHISVNLPSTAAVIDPVESVSATVSDTASLVSPGTPTAPLTLAGSTGSNGAVNLTWSAPTGIQ